MINYPKTLEEAKKYRYNTWAGNPNGTPYDPTRCAYEIFKNFTAWQCTRKNGYGPGGLYCKQHAKIVERWGN